MTRIERSDPRWTAAVATLAVLLAAVLFAYRDTALAMVAIWSRSDTFAHAFLVPPISAWLVWRKRHALAACVPAPNAWMLLPIAVASGAWLVGDLAAANAVAQLALTALVVFVVVAVLGLRAGRVIAFPLVFLFFSVPVGEFVMPQMMQWTADFAVLGLRLSGIPVYREGLQFVVPSGNWSVVEACSGIRYLIASIMVGTLFAYLNYVSLRRRLIFVGISIVVPVVANWVRAYLIVLLGDLSGNAAAVSADHLIYGWIFFGIVITLMFMIGSRWSEAPAAAGASAPPRHPAAVPPLGTVHGMAIAVAAAVLFLLPHAAVRGWLDAARPGPPVLDLPAELPGGWRLEADGGSSSFKPAYTGHAAESNRYYVRGADRIGVYIGYYRHQDYARKLVSSDNQVVTLHDPNWSATGEVVRTTSIGGTPRSFRVTSVRAASHIAQNTAVRLQVWRTYWIDGALTSNDNWAKLYVAWEKLRGRGDDAAVVMVYRQVGEESDAGDPLLVSFLQAQFVAVSQTLSRTRDAAPSSVAAASMKER